MKRYRLQILPDIVILLSITVLLLAVFTDTPSDSISIDEESSGLILETTIPYEPITDESRLDKYMDHDSGRAMDYHIYIPDNATENMPLIVYLHGTGAIGSPAYNENNPAITQARAAYGDEFPFILLAPSSMYNRSWNVKYVPDLVKSLVDYIADLYNVDRDKIIIFGHSMGAIGVFRQIERFGDFYSAAVPVSLTNVDNINIEASASVPIWGFSGTEESPHEYNMRKLFDQINELGGNTMFSAIEGAEHGDSADYAFTREVFEWALAQ